MISLGLGITSGRFGVPNFLRAGRSQAFIAALNEAAATGLALDFQTPQYWLRGARQGNFASGVSGATYARTGSRAGFDAAVVYSANVPRIAAVNGLRVHGAGTNLVRASEAFDDAAWTKTNSTITANSAVAPDGTMTADKIVENTANAAHGVTPGSTSVTSGTSYTQTVFAKAGERTWLRIGQNSTADSLVQGFAWFNLSSGAVGTVQAGVTATITALANGWYRCRASWTAGATSSNASFVLRLADADNSQTYTGDGTSGIPVWGAQLEQSSFATDYIPNPNTGASSSAGADDVQVAASALPTSGPIVFLADLPAQVFNSGTGPRIFDWAGPLLSCLTTDVFASAGAGTAATVSGLATSGARRIAMLYTVGGATRLSVNGSAVAVGTDVGGAIPTAVNYIGNRAALDRPLNGGLGVFAVYRATPTDAQLQAMSAL
jgi:hypothetical protein